MKNVLVSGSWFRKEDLDRLSEVANVVHLRDLENKRNLDSVLPTIDILLTASWPSSLTEQKIAKMENLKMVQCLFAGVDSLPISIIPSHVLLCSNAGAYSQEVAEHAWALTLAASKCIPLFLAFPKNQPFFMDRMLGVSARMVSLEGRTAGVIGYGGIGSSFASMATAFGMKVVAFSRRSIPQEKGVEILQGKEGLNRLLGISDVMLLSLPLTKYTRGIIGSAELSMMKEKAILVNVARGDLVERSAMLRHLKTHPNFWYATDVGWHEKGKEIADPDNEFGGLDNYLVTPHVAGVNSQPTGKPSHQAVQNVIRYIQDSTPANVIDKSEY